MALLLNDLGRQSQEILAGSAVDVPPQLLKAVGSPDGARPKVLVGETAGPLSLEAFLQTVQAPVVRSLR